MREAIIKFWPEKAAPPPTLLDFTEVSLFTQTVGRLFTFYNEMDAISSAPRHEKYLKGEPENHSQKKRVSG